MVDVGADDTPDLGNKAFIFLAEEVKKLFQGTLAHYNKQNQYPCLHEHLLSAIWPLDQLNQSNAS